MNALEELKTFEDRVDKEIENLDFIKLPINSVLTVFYHLIGELMLEGQTFVAIGWILNMSYLFPLLINGTLEVGRNAKDACPVITEKQEFKKLSFYIRFCDLMPLIHKNNYYKVTKESNSFILQYPEEKCKKHEEDDMILGEISYEINSGGGLSKASKRKLFNNTFRDLEFKDLEQSLTFYYENNQRTAFWDSKDFHDCIGVTDDQFYRIKAMLLAISDYYHCKDMILCHLINSRNKRKKNKRLPNELAKSLAVSLKKIVS